ncbi:MAG: ribbon-helix-helix domain-containing protein [Patescibacteria group bacterium]|nr:ribbon-helix-helix domain-containing protein [Patescibacteria group bacterium]
MLTINISLPDKLKLQTEALVKKGYYASFSDIVRDSLRHLLERSKFDLWAEQAKEDLEKGKATILNSEKSIDEYFKDL